METHVSFGDQGDLHDRQAKLSSRIADESFAFRTAHFPLSKITGTQVAEAAGAFPIEDFVVLQWLKTRELETLRPTELAAVVDSEGFFVIKGSELFCFYVDGRSMAWPRPKLSGDKIKRLAGYDHLCDVELILEREKTPDEVIQDDQEVELGKPGVERFKIRRLPLTIYVDGEAFDAPKPEMTPNEIIAAAAHLDITTHYLSQLLADHKEESYNGKGDVPIHLHRGMQFIVIALGPTTVSDPRQDLRGVAAFTCGLRVMGIAATPLPNTPNHIIFDYTVACGKFIGQKVRIGLVIPDDFPMTAPSGPYVSPEVLPINPNGAHPLGGVHKTHAFPFEAGAGGLWEYWSRPCAIWRSGTGSVHAYMAHIAKLWATQ